MNPLLIDILHSTAALMAMVMLPFAMAGWWPCCCKKICTDFCDGGAMADEIVITVTGVVDRVDVGLCGPNFNCSSMNGSYTLVGGDLEPDQPGYCTRELITTSGGVPRGWNDLVNMCQDASNKKYTIAPIGRPITEWWADVSFSISGSGMVARYKGASNVSDCCDLDETLAFDAVLGGVPPTGPCYFGSSSVEIVGQGCE